jgi:hypothetical protein
VCRQLHGRHILHAAVTLLAAVGSIHCVDVEFIIEMPVYEVSANIRRWSARVN